MAGEGSGPYSVKRSVRLRLWSCQQHLVPFPIVAFPAGGYEIVHAIIATARLRDYMVNLKEHSLIDATGWRFLYVGRVQPGGEATCCSGVGRSMTIGTTGLESCPFRNSLTYLHLRHRMAILPCNPPASNRRLSHFPHL